ncbi:oligopeptide/dipeptide ABC transporter ATP-binding protein [Jannaschia sp. R86511]|uniref:oligopeptide/dipeptide ABC transporter ATP-binding protein n=1 Tax=Jannaschia sp. R86511 TaxID=3093853 RepID=UPI0036D2C28B
MTVRGLTVTFPGLPTVHGVDLDLAPGRLTAVVGESGAGKSVVVAALLGLLPRSAQVSGRMRLPDDGAGALDVDLGDRTILARQVRGRRVSLVPQSPATWITPVRTLGSQLHEAARAVRDRSVTRPAVADAVRTAVGRAQLPEDLLDRYPHEVSGGQLQRAALALALVGGARVLLADEPTTGLDPGLAGLAMGQLRAEADDGAAVLVVSHDLAAAERVADEVVVLYAGRVVERATTAAFVGRPAHPYSAGLLDALPDRAFRSVPGDPPAPGEQVGGCAFRPRCAHAVQRCLTVPALAEVAPTAEVAPLAPDRTDPARLVACHRPFAAAPAGTPTGTGS